MSENCRWIVGVDGSDSSQHALDWATTHADGRATELQVLTAWQAPLYGPFPMVGPMTSPYDTDALRAAAERDARRLAQAVAAQVDIPVEPVAVHGGASSSLLEAAEHASLLIVGNRGRGGFRRLLLGSTSNQVATHAEVPTVIVRHDAPVASTDRILVGVDGSPNSLAALNWAIDFASPGTSIDVVWVWDASPLAVGADQFFFPEATDLARQRLDEVLVGAAGRAAQGSVALRRHFVEGTPRTVLTECGSRADLVVIGARGHGAIGAALLGSVSNWLVHHLDRATVVVPNREEPAASARLG